MAQRPARPGGRLSPSRHNGREGHGQAFPPVNELVDLDVHLFAGRRRAGLGSEQTFSTFRCIFRRRGLTTPPWGDNLGAGLWLASSEFSILERSIDRKSTRLNSSHLG